jgi:hypothetical protein
VGRRCGWRGVRAGKKAVPRSHHGAQLRHDVSIGLQTLHALVGYNERGGGRGRRWAEGSPQEGRTLEKEFDLKLYVERRVRRCEDSGECRLANQQSAK